jgi:hypothetical protein
METVRASKKLTSACKTVAAIIWIWLLFYFLWRCDPTRVMASSFLRFLDHAQRRTTVDRTSLDEWSARRRDLYLTHNAHNRQTSMPLGGIRNHDLNGRTAADLRLRPRCHWDRQYEYMIWYIFNCNWVYTQWQYIQTIRRTKQSTQTIHRITQFSN